MKNKIMCPLNVDQAAGHSHHQEITFFYFVFPDVFLLGTIIDI